MKKIKLTPTEKKQMLIDVINLSYNVGRNATSFVGHPLSYYNFEAVLNVLKKYNIENIEQGGDDFFEFNDSYAEILENI